MLHPNRQTQSIGGSNTSANAVGSGILCNLIVTVSGSITIYDGETTSDDVLIPACTYPIGVHRLESRFTNALLIATDAIARATITYEQDIEI